MKPIWSADPHLGVDLPLGDLLAYGLQTCPETVALFDHRASFTYAELESLASSFASVFSEQYNIRAQDRVMVLTHKTCVVPAVAIGLWKIGAIYMPVDASLPVARLARIVEHAAPALIVGFGQSPRFLGEYADLETLLHRARRYDRPSYDHSPDDTAYVIHTSGTTGTPKGVQISAHNLKSYFRAHNTMLRFDKNSRVLSLAPFHFDVSIEDTFLPLSLGASVYQYNRLPHGGSIRSILKREQITHLIAVSTLLTMISDDPSSITRESFPQLEMVMTGAEVCAPSVINLWASRLPDLRVYNVYGPTEVTIVCLGYQIEEAEMARTIPYPIGRPLDGVHTMLLDQSDSEITEFDTPGELCIGGDQVMLGYLAQPQETKKRIFTSNGVRFYRSGDQCTKDRNGLFHFVGRKDNEVKLNGRRIDLVEVQSECLATPGVQRAAVGLMTGSRGQPVIGVVLVTDAHDLIGVVRARLLSRLPSYMVPSLWGTAPNIRLASTGKSADLLLLSELERTAQATKLHECRLEIPEAR